MIIMRGIAVHAGVCYAYESACSDWLRAKIYKLSSLFFFYIRTECRYRLTGGGHPALCATQRNEQKRVE